MLGLGDGQLIVNEGDTYKERVLTDFGCGQIADSSEIDIIADAVNKTVTFSVLKGDGIKCNTEKLTHPMLQDSLGACRLAVSLAYGASVEIMDPPPAQLWRQMKAMANKVRQARTEKKSFDTVLAQAEQKHSEHIQNLKDDHKKESEQLKKDFEEKIESMKAEQETEIKTLSEIFSNERDALHEKMLGLQKVIDEHLEKKN